MTRNQRKKHLFIWIVLGVVLPVLFGYGYFKTGKVEKNTEVKIEVGQ